MIQFGEFPDKQDREIFIETDSWEHYMRELTRAVDRPGKNSDSFTQLLCTHPADARRSEYVRREFSRVVANHVYDQVLDSLNAGDEVDLGFGKGEDVDPELRSRIKTLFSEKPDAVLEQFLLRTCELTVENKALRSKVDYMKSQLSTIEGLTHKKDFKVPSYDDFTAESAYVDGAVAALKEVREISGAPHGPDWRKICQNMAESMEIMIDLFGEVIYVEDDSEGIRWSTMQPETFEDQEPTYQTINFKEMIDNYHAAREKNPQKNSEPVTRKQP